MSYIKNAVLLVLLLFVGLAATNTSGAPPLPPPNNCSFVPPALRSCFNTSHSSPVNASLPDGCCTAVRIVSLSEFLYGRQRICECVHQVLADIPHSANPRGVFDTRKQQVNVTADIEARCGGDMNLGFSLAGC